MAPSALKCTWRQLPLEGISPPLAARSSHSLSILNRKAYIFGGELKPRTPIGNEVIIVDLQKGGPVRVLRQKQSQPWPCARVGASMTSHPVSNSLFLWGGRGGKDMNAISVRSNNDEESTNEVDDVWKFDVQSEQWSKLCTKSESLAAFPCARSFHTMTADEEHLYIHAGCPAKGRLSEMHSLELATSLWSLAPSAPEPARGGTVITAVSSLGTDKADALIRWGGFCGYELGGPLDLFDIKTQQWTSLSAPIDDDTKSEPAMRSVHGLVPFYGKKVIDTNQGSREVVAIMFMGEGKGAPAELGHDGAGKFLNDVYALLRAEDSSYSWLPLPKRQSTESAVPEPRGWFAFDAVKADQGGIDIIIHGGLHETNERLKDAWILHIE